MRPFAFVCRHFPELIEYERKLHAAHGQRAHTHYDEQMLIKVRVKTEAKNEKILKKADDMYEIAVRDKPEANMANKRVLALLAAELSLPASKLRIIKGHHSPSKTISTVDT